MELLKMYERVKRLTWNPTYTEEDFILDLNTVKDKFWSKAVQAFDDDRHYDEWTIDWWTLTNQSEYSLDEVATNNEWVKILKSVAINYNGKTHINTGKFIFKPAIQVNKDALSEEWWYYEENQDPEHPIYFIADNSIFIAPVPKIWQAWNWRLKVTGIKNIADYTINTTNLIIPSDFHSVLEAWVIIYCLKSKRTVNINEIIEAKNEYEKLELNAINQLWNKEEGIIYMNYPN